ncbi:MAG: choice-of-anchor Q domain-containing protein, partial [bacterium]
CCVTPDECAKIGSSAPLPCPLGVCVKNTCTTMAGSCDGDEDCRAPSPVCVLGGCAACGSDDGCPASRPVCDTVTHDCRACSKDNECASGACDLAAGTCVDPAAIRYAAPSGTNADACTQMAPCSLGHAASLGDGDHPYIVLAPGIHPTGAIFNGRIATIAGNSATIDLRSSLIQISSASIVRIRDVDIIANQGFTISGTRNAISCDSNSELVLERVRGTFKDGVNALNSDGAVTMRQTSITDGAIFTTGPLTVDQSTFTNSRVTITSSGAPFEIANSLFIAGPSGTRLSISQNGGSNSNGALVLNNTFIGASLGCQGGTFQHIESNIFYNSTMLDTGVQCEYNYNLIFPSVDVGGMGNRSNDPLFEDPAGSNFRLKQGSDAIDHANPNRAPPFGHDHDGVMRPRGGGTDIGAFEYVPQA